MSRTRPRVCRAHRTPPVFGIAVAILSALAGLRGVNAEETEYAARCRAARCQAIGALEEVARHCHRAKLYKERDRVAREILCLAPDSECARKYLKFYRTKSGDWERRGPYREPRNIGARVALKALPKRRARLLSDATESLWHLVGHPGDEVHSKPRADALRLLIALHPEDGRYRRANGEVRGGGGWVLEESMDARTRHREIKALVAAIRSRVPRPSSMRRRPLERTPLLSWAGRAATPEIRVLGTGSAHEAVGVARDLHACRVLFRTLLEVDLPPEPGLTVWLLAVRSEHEALVSALPMDDAKKERVLQCGGFWLRGGETAVESSTTPAGRRDGALRMVISHDLRRAFPDLHRHAALREGVGIYLTHLLTGTRLSILIEDSGYAADDSTENDDPRAGTQDWVRLARDAIRQDRLPPLRDVLGTTLNALQGADLLYANALVQYLFEGRAQDAAAFLHGIARSGVVNDASVQVLRLDLPALDGRVRRWTTEMAAP